MLIEQRRERETRKHPDNKGSMIDIDNATEPEPEHEPDVSLILQWLRQNPLTSLQEPCTEKAEK